MILKAYAKINLTLDIKGKRADGYHLLSSIMQEISLYDEIALLVKNGKGYNDVLIKCSDDSVPEDSTNICYKAGILFLEHFGITNKLVKIAIKKGIPVGAGLGGGSSDAAAVIRGLNKMLCVGADDEELEKIAIEVGSDVPFFIRGGTQHVEGTGEKLSPVDCPIKPYFIVAMNGHGVSTKDVYEKYDMLDRETFDGSGKFLHAMSFGINPYDFMSNALTDAACELDDNIAFLLKKLSESSEMVSMSGSGSSVFAVYDSYSRAFEILQKNKKEFDFIALCVRKERAITEI